MTSLLKAYQDHPAAAIWDGYRIERRDNAPSADQWTQPSRNTYVSDGFPEAGGGGCAAATDGAPATASGDSDDDDGGGDPDPEPERRRRQPVRRAQQSTTSPSPTTAALLLTLPDVLAQCQLSRSQIYALVARGEFPEPIKIGRSTRWLAKEFEAWIEQHLAKRSSGRPQPPCRPVSRRRAAA